MSSTGNIKVLAPCDSADSTGIVLIHSASSFELKTRVSAEATPHSPARMDPFAFKVDEAEEISTEEEELKEMSPSYAAAGCMPLKKGDKGATRKVSAWKQVANSAKKRIGKLRKLFATGSSGSSLVEVGESAAGLIFDASPERRKKELRALASHTSSRMKQTTIVRRELAPVGKIDPCRVQLLEDLFRKRDAPFPPSSSRVHVERPIGALTPTRVEMVKAILKTAPPPEQKKPGSASSSAFSSRSAFGLPRRKTDVSPSVKISVEKAAKKIELARAKSTASAGSAGSDPVELSETSLSLGTVLPPLLVPESLAADDMSEDVNAELDSELMMIAKESGLSPRDIIMEAVKEEIKEEEEAHMKFPDLDVLVDSALENAPELKVFCIDGNPLWEGFAVESEERIVVSKLLAEAIAFNEYFTEISFCNCGVTDEFVEEICNWILKGKLKQIRVLKLKGNMLGSLAINALCSILELPTASVEELHIGEQFPALSIDTEKMIARSVRINTSLVKIVAKFQSEEVREVIFSSTKRNAAAKRSEDTVKFLTDVEKKILGVINHQSACVSGDDDEETASLEIDGDFTFTLLSSSEKLALAKSLKLNATLQVLRLANVGIGDDFCIALAESLADNSCLHVLDLSGNSYTEIGFSALSAALSCNRSLKSVNLSGALSVSPAVEADFLKFLEKNDKIISLDLPKSMSASTVEAVKRILSRNCFLKVKQWEMMSSPSIAKKGF